mgnify:FL=1
MEKKKQNRLLVVILLIIAICIIVFPLFLHKDAEFGGTDDQGNTLIEETDPDYEPWAAPLIENILGRELPGETESMLFCVQTGIGVGIIAFIMGRLVERRKWMNRENLPEDRISEKKQERSDAYH